jgi:hypothetical protein
MEADSRPAANGASLPLLAGAEATRIS